MKCISHRQAIAERDKYGNWYQLKLFHITGFCHAIRAVLAWPLLVIGLYFAAAFIGSSIPSNANAVQPKDGIPIFVETNGVHVSLIVPITLGGEDLSDLIRPDQLREPAFYGTHAMIGWGHGGVYRHSETWAKVRSGDVASAVFGSDDVLLHIYHLSDPQVAPGRKMLRVTPDQYHSIIRQIRAAFLLNARGESQESPAYGPDNVFYMAHGHYTAIHTCNSWSGDVLRGAGVRTGIWTPMPGGVMKWF
jgi:uncharacterized protein (TIGR02117 family)